MGPRDCECGRCDDAAWSAVITILTIVAAAVGLGYALGTVL